MIWGWPCIGILLAVRWARWWRRPPERRDPGSGGRLVLFARQEGSQQLRQAWATPTAPGAGGALETDLVDADGAVLDRGAHAPVGYHLAVTEDHPRASSPTSAPGPSASGNLLDLR